MSLYRCAFAKPGWGRAAEALSGASVEQVMAEIKKLTLFQRMVEIKAPLGSFGVIPGGIHAPSALCGCTFVIVGN